ncbi:cell division regulator GpsB [Streptococcus troglodytae]|uniref:Cell cycle protein GpsB n=1 Tax=Streptococcus troglodytae TaxID=1111760 RepID=A0A1L7LL26_9STRE|nr:cell division regulator GpsB [Streptococcus troglodytae]BAQ24907.1 DivIVA domain protein [Streptococcus troglodytae]
MASIMYTPKDIFEQEFKSSMRGYDKKEVDEFLDDIIKDYETYISTIEELRQENTRLKEEVKQAKKRQEAAQTTVSPAASVGSSRVATTATNFDILKRISRLEKEVFGKQITE